MSFSFFPENGVAENRSGSGYFYFSANARAAYDAMLALRFHEARNTLLTMQREEPDNLLAVFIENYAECLEIFIDDN